MDLAQRLNFLESCRDWYTLLEELERALQSEADPTTKAQLFFKLGSVLDERFLQGVKALKHFQDAYKLNPTLLAALERARGIYWELGKTPMVSKLLDIELRSLGDGPEAVPLLIELGDVLSDGGDFDRATATYAKALSASGGQSDEARAGLVDAQLGDDSWAAHVAQLVELGLSQSGPEACRTLLRAARIARRFGSADAEAIFGKAYEAHPTDAQAACVYEGLLVASDRAAQLEQQQHEHLEQLTSRGKAQVAFRFGSRWATRHQNLEVGARFLEEALANDPQRDGALAFLKELWGTRDQNWDRALGIAEKAANAKEPSEFAIAQAGIIAWRNQGNLMRARGWFEKLAAVDPEHPTVAAFEGQIGESLRGGGTSEASQAESEAEATSEPEASQAPDVAEAADVADAADVAGAAGVAEAPEVAEAPAAVESPEDAAPEPAPVSAAQDEHVDAAPPSAAPPPVASSAPPARAATAPAEASPPADPEKVAEIRQRLEKLQAAKRMTEYVKTLVELAEHVDDVDEKVALYLEAADLYTTKFPNAAEAVKCFEAVLAIDENNQAAMDHLRATYEKRRDWEKLIGLMKREVPRHREARDRARQEAGRLHRALERSARERRGERRRSRRVGGALRALEGVREARDGAREAGRGHVRLVLARGHLQEARAALWRSPGQR